MLIRTKESSMRNLKGKNVSEFQRNLISAGFPSEMTPEATEKVRNMESKLGRPLRSTDLPNRGRQRVAPIWGKEK